MSAFEEKIVIRPKHYCAVCGVAMTTKQPWVWYDGFPCHEKCREWAQATMAKKAAKKGVPV